MLSFLRLLQLSSSNLPVGGFTYSQGLEWAVEAGWVTNAEQTNKWFQNQMKTSLKYSDLPIIDRLYISCINNDIEQFSYWTQKILLLRETKELRLEESQRGSAFFRFLQGLDCFDLVWKDQNKLQTILKQSQIAGITWYAVNQQIPLELLQYSWSYSWLEGNIMAAIKLVPLGQQAGQKLLYELSAQIPSLVTYSKQILDDEIGAGSPLVAIASSRHETQYTRLFRS